MLNQGAVIADRYEIVGLIGSGGMADVYKGKDRKLSRFVAVKVMKNEFSNDDSFIRKFRREAQAAAGLANPNIVSVYDFGEDNGLYFIVMELVEGITLKEYVAKKHKLSVREATSIAIQVCMGLSAAHAQGIVHRDIKPQNIIISTDGKVKVTDFGIARVAMSNTISANAMGSVHYSSPEQVRGGYSDAKSDIYSLGITLYEMVTGRVPFDGETTVAIAIKHLQDEMDPPSKYTPDLPYSLEQIIYKCTQKNPDRRYSNVNEMIEDMKRSLTDPDGHFVALAPLADHAGTVTMSKAEMQAIRDKDSAKRGEKSSAKDISKSYSDDDDDEYYDDDEGGLSSGLEKVMTIGGFIIGAIIICILIFFIGRAAGLFKTGRGSEEPEQQPTPAAESTESAQITPIPGDEDIECPRLLGLTREQAQVQVQGMPIGTKYGGEEPSDEYPAGQICRQEIAPGTMIARNTTIVYYVSTGRDEATIPSGVVGSTEEDAKTLLRNAGFTNVKTTESDSEEVAIGSVISITPAEGSTISPDEVITLEISTGSVELGEEVTISSVRGINIDVARSILEKNGLRIKIEYGHTNDLAIDDVMAISPSVGTKVPKGSTVTLTVNRPQSEIDSGDTPQNSGEESAPQQSEESQAEESNESEEESSSEVKRTWVTDVKLDATSEYQEGPYRLTLVQSVNGTNEELIVEEGSNLSFPYEFKYSKGVDGQASGDVFLYEQVGDTYVRKAKWTVPFSAS